MEGLNKISEVNKGIWTIACVVLGLIGYLYYSLILYPYYLGPLKNLPRKKSGLWHYYNYMRKSLKGDPEVHMELSLEYGPVVHLKNNLVLINETSIRKSYMTYKFPKSKIYEGFDINGPNIFSAINKGFHQRVRKLILPAFSNKTLADIEPTIYRVGSESLVKYLESYLDTQPSKEFDIMYLFHADTLDVISELVFGETLNTIWDEKKGLYCIKELEKSQYILFLRQQIALFRHIKLPMETLFKPMILENINKRRNSNEVHTDILQSMIDSKDPETGEYLTDLEIVDECLTLLLAGMDTTANSLTWILYEVIKNPRIYKLVADEIVDKFPNLNEPISLERAKNELKYLSAAILEGFRMHPVAAGFLPREVPEGGLNIDGHYLPAKTAITLDIYTQHNDPNFWKTPREFDLNRWLGPDAEANKNKLAAFGFGPRSCIGRDLAKAEIYLVLTNLLRHFNFELADKELIPTNKFVYQPKSNRFKVKVSRRV